MQVAKVVAPKKAKLAEAEASYQEVMVGLTAKQAELQVCAGSSPGPGFALHSPHEHDLLISG